MNRIILLILLFALGSPVSADMLYWANMTDDKIQRANLDGTGIEDVITGLSSPRGLALDPDGGKIYWTETISGRIRRANFDGTGIETIAAAVKPWAIAVIHDLGKVYWSDIDASDVYSTRPNIRRANLDGSSDEDIISLPEPRSPEAIAAMRSFGIALGPPGQLFWTQINGIVKKFS